MWRKIIGAGLGFIVAASLLSTNAVASPFSCNGDLYQVQAGQLKLFHPATGLYTDYGAAQPFVYNAAAFNSNDGYIYAYDNSGTNTRIIRIDQNGVVITVNTQSPLSADYAADMDYNDNLISRSKAKEITYVNVVTGLVTKVAITGASMPTATGDLSYIDPALGGGTAYILAPNNGQLVVINLSTNVAVSKPVSGFPNTEGFSGASWIDASGRFLVFRNNTGNVYEIFNYLTADPHAVLLANGIANNKNDGLNCKSQPFFNNAPIAKDDAFTTTINVAVSGNVLIDNGNGIDTDPNDQTLSINTAPVTQPTNGTVTLNANGTFTYTPNSGFSGTDSFEYELTDPYGLTDTAVVTIDIPSPTNVAVEKTVALYVPAGTGLYAVPGNDVLYTITITNTGAGGTDPDSLFLVDRLPMEIKYFNNDIDGTGPQTGPVMFSQNPGGTLTFNPATDVAYSNLNAKPTQFTNCNYTPTVGYDDSVQYICFNPKGTLSAGHPQSYAAFSFRAQIQ